jgi:methylisocitrate lyase
MIANLSPSTPVIADADTGYGGPIMVARTVEQYARAGVAALHIEDQVQTKRCGHLAGKLLVDLDVYLTRIRAAVQARRRIGSDIVIIARTDSLQKHGYDEALTRLRAARDAGADAAFFEGLRSVEEAQRMIADLAPWPVLLNMVENSVTPKLSAKEAKDLGFRIMIVPLASLAPAYIAIKDGLQKLKETGSVDTPLTPQKLFRVCGLDESMKIDEEAGADTFEGGVD